MRDYAIVIAGGRIDDDFALRFLYRQLAAGGSSSGKCSEKGDPERPMLIAADRGLTFLERHGIVPELVVGDFDSVQDGYVEQYLLSHPEVEVQEYSWEKDWTDTEIAARSAVERGCKRVDLLGVTGTRIDHMMGSIQLLAMLSEMGVTGRILDPYNRITMHRESFRIQKEDQWGKYVSFFAWGGDVCNVTLSGFHFPMKDGRITSSRTLTVSNQIEEESAEVTFSKGMLLMVESKDDE